jgi:hypothetical protein
MRGQPIVTFEGSRVPQEYGASYPENISFASSVESDWTRSERMGELIRNNVRERYLDLLDWVDIRPDLNMTWCAGFVVIIGLMVYFLPSSMMIAATMFAFFAAGGLMAAFIVGAFGFVCFQAGTNVWKQLKSEAAPRHASVGTILRQAMQR